MCDHDNYDISLQKILNFLCKSKFFDFRESYYGGGTLRDISFPFYF